MAGTTSKQRKKALQTTYRADRNAYQDINQGMIEGKILHPPKIVHGKRNLNSSKGCMIWIVVLHILKKFDKRGRVKFEETTVPVMIEGPNAWKLSRILRAGMFVYVSGKLRSFKKMVPGTNVDFFYSLYVRTTNVRFTELVGADELSKAANLTDYASYIVEE